MDLESRGILLSMKQKQNFDQLQGYRVAYLHLCFRISKNRLFHEAACIMGNQKIVL